MQEIDILQSQLDVYTEILNNTNDAVIITDENNKIIKINKACEDVTGYFEDEVLGENPKIFSSDKTSNETFEKIWKTLQTNSFWIGELSNRHKNGLVYPIVIKIYKIKNPKTGILNYFAIFSDISYSEESQNELFHLAYHDSLTNLPNRLKLKAQLEYVITNSKRNDLKFAILFLDLDNFKEVNDTLGHNYGDALLISLASKFKNIIRTNDMVARVGGDEFIIVLSDITDFIFIEKICNKILALVKNPIVIDGKEVNVGISIGVSVYPENGEDIEELIHNADSAMYQVKYSGKNGFELFSDDMNRRILAHSNREKELINAIKNDEFIIHFQPEIDTKSNDVFSLEILSRWNHITDGVLMPGNFIHDLEISNLIFDFEKLILKKACIQLKQWQDENFYKGTVSVNISGKHLKYGNLFENVKEVLESTNIEPKCLELEFNEKDIVNIEENRVELLKKLSNLGVILTLDNFGRSFTSFNHLRNCHITKLKIDKSYIDSLANDNSDEDIIKSIIDLGSNMNISVIAEGIELKEQNQILRKNQCSKVQGYYYAKPMNIIEFENWYKNSDLYLSNLI